MNYKIVRLFNIPKWIQKIGIYIPILREQLVLWNYSHMILSTHYNDNIGALMIYKEPIYHQIHWYQLECTEANKFFRDKIKLIQQPIEDIKG